MHKRGHVISSWSRLNKTLQNYVQSNATWSDHVMIHSESSNWSVCIYSIVISSVCQTAYIKPPKSIICDLSWEATRMLRQIRLLTSNVIDEMKSNHFTLNICCNIFRWNILFADHLKTNICQEVTLPNQKHLKQKSLPLTITFLERRIKIFMNVFCGHEGIITPFQAVNSIMKGNINDLAERIELNLPIVQP